MAMQLKSCGVQLKLCLPLECVSNAPRERICNFTHQAAVFDVVELGETLAFPVAVAGPHVLELHRAREPRRRPCGGLEVPGVRAHPCVCKQQGECETVGGGGGGGVVLTFSPPKILGL
jgi:hypothetical protein